VTGVKDASAMHRRLQEMCGKVLPGLLARGKVNIRCYGRQR
jgi:hypothetical protein